MIWINLFLKKNVIKAMKFEQFSNSFLKNYYYIKNLIEMHSMLRKILKIYNFFTPFLCSNFTVIVNFFSFLWHSAG